MSKKKPKFEALARETLEARLDSDETLLEFTTGSLAMDRNRRWYVGLTSSRLIYVPFKRGKPSDTTIGIWRGYLASAKWTGKAFARLHFKFGKQRSSVTITGNRWGRRASELARIANELEPPPAYPEEEMRQVHEEHVEHFNAIGMYSLALELKKRVEEGRLAWDPQRSPSELGAFTIDRPAATALLFETVLRVISLFLLNFALRFVIASVVAQGFDYLTVYLMYRERSFWRWFVLLRALIGFSSSIRLLLIYGGFGSVVGVLIQFSYALAVLFVYLRTRELT